MTEPTPPRDDDRDVVEVPADPPMNPGDEVAPGTSHTGEMVCGTCRGTGMCDAVPCPVCGGSGRVIQNIGDA